MGAIRRPERVQDSGAQICLSGRGTCLCWVGPWSWGQGLGPVTPVFGRARGPRALQGGAGPGAQLGARGEGQGRGTKFARVGPPGVSGPGSASVLFLLPPRRLPHGEESL